MHFLQERRGRGGGGEFIIQREEVILHTKTFIDVSDYYKPPRDEE